jgi:hypothetical protein
MLPDPIIKQLRSWWKLPARQRERLINQVFSLADRHGLDRGKILEALVDRLARTPSPISATSAAPIAAT